MASSTSMVMAEHIEKRTWFERGERLLYRVETNRRESFETWPLAHLLDIFELASAGFYYTGVGNFVCCFECGVKINDWTLGEKPSCRFVRRIPCGNVPVGINPDTVAVPTFYPYRKNISPVISPSFRYSYYSAAVSRLEHREFLSLFDYVPPPYPVPQPEIDVKTAKVRQYLTYDVRLKSYGYWPRHMSQTKEKLAEAGFFYTGIGDYVQCYHCGNGLKDWLPNEDPWEEHARYFKECYFVRVIKGQEFIDHFKIPQTDDQPSDDEEEAESLTIESNSIVIMRNIPTDYHSIDEDIEFKCKICFEKNLGILFLPCRHFVSCGNCSTDLKKCVICRADIEKVVRPIIS
ncbi:death-associated inhibitor of apoptosis 1-like [Aphidius gifuensis]|uniref:death-associated inhibitor of apoptosis 1-like n=1 Tax=Aphidius gifuensis TaxID=684658 RepID=UPI001CDC349B|nr:death-associated inhibitor of apoptosis 1-like [Aphidius gifuensis]